MSGISSTQSSTARITGLYSQLDTDKIVKDLLNIQQTKVNAKSQEKTKQEWFGDAVSEVRSLLNDFRNNYLSALGKDSMVVSSAYNNLKTEITGVDSAAISITAKSSAFTGSYSVDYIEQIAKNASVSSGTMVSVGGKGISESNTTKLEDLKFANKLEFDQNGKISFGINGETFTFDRKTTLQTMINTVNSNEKAGVTMKYSRLTDRFTIEADSGGSESKVSIANYSGNAFGGTMSAFGIGTGSTDQAGQSARLASSGRLGKIIPPAQEGDPETYVSISATDKLGDIKDNFATALEFGPDGKLSFKLRGDNSIGPVQFDFDSETTIQSMVETVNAQKDKTGVTMSFNSSEQRFVFESVKADSSGWIEIENVSGNAFMQYDEVNKEYKAGAFGIEWSSSQGRSFGEKGQDAILSIDGTRITRNSNNFSIDGIDYSLKAKTSVQPTDGKVDSPAIRFQVNRDVSSTVDKVKQFITAYNELTNKLNGKLSEKDMSKKYAPLTPEQENELSESQIETWNKKAKSGLLRNNQELRLFLQEVKNNFFSSLSGTGRTAASIGLSTGNYFTSDSDKIILDEATLTRALEENPDIAMNMFTGTEKGAEGLMRKMTDSVNNYIKKLDSATKASDKKLRGLDDKIKDMEDNLDKLAERYYQKFSVMEQAMGKLNSQMGFLSTLLSS